MNTREKAAAFFIVVTLPITLPLVLVLLIFESLEMAALIVVLVSGWAATFAFADRFDANREQREQSTDNPILGVFQERYVEGKLSERDLERKIEQVLDTERTDDLPSESASDRAPDLTDE